MCERPIYAVKSPTGGRPLIIKGTPKETEKERLIQLPCGKCLSCRLEHARQWSVRCVLESKRWQSNMFLTFTYADEHLPQNGVDKKELSDFIKLLRQHYQRYHNHQGIRFFCCGEYGKKYLRPHYHVILFNCPPFGDEIQLFKNKLGQPIYTSQKLLKLWQNKGLCSIGAVTQQSAGYVARYSLKKVTNALPDGYNPEFINMSRNSGIGSDYFNDNWENIYRYDEIILPEGKTVKPPKAYDRKLKNNMLKQYGYKEIDTLQATNENDFLNLCVQKEQMQILKQHVNEVFDNTIKLPRQILAKAMLQEEIDRTGLTEQEIQSQRTERLHSRVKRLRRTWEENRTEHHY